MYNLLFISFKVNFLIFMLNIFLIIYQQIFITMIQYHIIIFNYFNYNMDLKDYIFIIKKLIIY